MYIPFNRAKQRRYYTGLFRKFLSWNMDETELTAEEKQEITNGGISGIYRGFKEV